MVEISFWGTIGSVAVETLFQIALWFGTVLEEEGAKRERQCAHNWKDGRTEERQMV
jgi:hypothetical protein